jgi:hypothetical protein
VLFIERTRIARFLSVMNVALPLCDLSLSYHGTELMYSLLHFLYVPKIWCLPPKYDFTFSSAFHPLTLVVT